jgi:hypothetical protein
LYNIITDEEKRKKLVMYINPPYAESGSTKKRDAKVGVNESMIHKRIFSKLSSYSKRELFAQFLARIYIEIPNCKIANFSTLKNLQSSYFSDFREIFRAKLAKIFLAPADTFDNVKGKFPIGFFVWDSNINEKFHEIIADVYEKDGEESIERKRIFSYEEGKYINDWLRPTWNNIINKIGFLACNGNDFQNQNGIFIQTNKNNSTSTYFKPIGIENLIQSTIYFAVRHCIEATWLNDRDQFLFPNDKWESDSDFQNDCLAFTLFSNNIQSQFGTNHWIPFTELEVNARSKFESNFMTDFINGKVKIENEPQDLFSQEKSKKESQKLEFSEEAKMVFDAGKNLWKYYHSQPNVNVNASLYDIREYFQGRNEKGKMNNKSDDETYMKLIAELRSALKILAKKIEPKVYEYGFLKE